MKPSRYNIISKMKDRSSYFIVNALSGHADVLEADEAQRLVEGRAANVDELATKGYLVDPEEELKRYRAAYLEFLDSRESDEVQLFFVPTYSCNFGCNYCYQAGYESAPGWPSKGLIDSFFSYVDKTFAGRRKYITLFGGEPLLAAKSLREGLEYFLSETSRRNLDIAVVTNGYFLKESLPLLTKASIREIQVTLDGPPEVHDRRRFLKGGGATFERIVEGIDAALANGIPINLRTVVDRENLQQLPALADIAISRGWTDHPKFKTQLGRNYELHECQSKPGRLQTRLELYEELYHLIKKNPQVLKFHRPAYHVAKFLADNGELPAPLFDSCPGCKTEWAFDYTGNIYSCTATVGKQNESLGTFYPEVSLKKESVAQWEERDVISIPQCKTCSSQLICGGGCAAVAKNKTGKLNAPDCRPVKELLELGMSHYFENGEINNGR